MQLSEAIKRSRKDLLFVSLAQKPGTTGTKFYSALFAHHSIHAEYFACECRDLASDLSKAKQTCNGVSITMPYKDQLDPYIDKWETPEHVANTIKICHKKLIAYNCDLLALNHLLPNFIAGKIVCLLGDGAMAKNVLTLANYYNSKVMQFSRKLGNWDQRHQPADVIVNATSVGMDPAQSPVETILAPAVVDCVIGNTKFIKDAQAMNKTCVKGNEIYMKQFMHQFYVYTGLWPDPVAMSRTALEVFND